MTALHHVHALARLAFRAALLEVVVARKRSRGALHRQSQSPQASAGADRSQIAPAIQSEDLPN
jgi:hypothetical protein